MGGDELVLRRCLASQWGLAPADQLAREYATLRALEATGVAPRPVALELTPDGPVLVEELVVGRAFDPRRDLAALMPALRRVHATPPPAALPALDPVAALREDGTNLLGRARAAGAPGDQLAALERLAAALPAPFDAGAPVLVHTDLNAGNLLVAPDGRVRLLDWEAARVGPAAWDLAHLLAPTTTLWDPATACRLDAAASSAALAAYGAEAVTRHVAALSRPIAFRALAWVVGARAEGLADGNPTLRAQLDRLLGHLLGSGPAPARR